MIPFKKFLLEAPVDENAFAVYAFGRLNPPTIGHGKLLQKLMDEGAEHHFMFLSHGKHDKVGAKRVERDANGYDTDPLDYNTKLKYVKMMFPEFNIMDEALVISPHTGAEFLVKMGYKNIAIVGGSDRAPEFEKYLKPWVVTNLGVNFQVINAGMRDADSCDDVQTASQEDLECMASASMARLFVSQGDVAGLRKITPNTIREPQFGQFFKAIESGMGEQHQKVGNRWKPISDL